MFDWLFRLIEDDSIIPNKWFIGIGIIGMIFGVCMFLTSIFWLIEVFK